MTDQPDLPPELLERVTKLLIGFQPLWAGIAWERLPDQVKKRALSNALAVAPDLIAHGRELERATLNQAKVPRKLTHDDFTLPEHRSKP